MRYSLFMSLVEGSKRRNLTAASVVIDSCIEEKLDR
jgi:hypothetical protein